jgi:septal ring-binding cell division protein DamX
MDGPSQREGRRLGTGRPRSDWRELLPSGGLVLLVLFLLFLGARLQVGEAPPAPVPSGPPPAARAAVPEVSLAGPPPAPAASPPASALPSRAPTPVEPRAAERLPTAPPAAPPRAEPAGAGVLADRAASDSARLASLGPGWTLQLLVACQQETATALVDRSGGAPSLFVLPASVSGRDCWRLCWGAYPDRDAAAAASDLPATLRAGLDRPIPRSIAEVLP